MSETVATSVTASLAEGSQTHKTANESGYTFGRFSFFPARQVVFKDGLEIRLGSRAAATLSLLVERAQEVITKDEILNVVWPSSVVDDVNLRVQIAALRRVFDDNSDSPQFIMNVTGRGYLFMSPVEHVGIANRTPQRGVAPPITFSGLPAPLGRFIGRVDAADEIVQLIADQRLVSIVGSGGIGKTTLAVAAAQRLSIPFPDGRFFVDLAAVSDEALVPFAVATACSVSVETEDPLAGLIAHLRDRRAFIILDNCEHVINAVAYLVEALLKGVPELKLLATSHEPLRAEGEWVFRLSPLEMPSREDMSLQAALRFPAIELFVERAMSDNRGLMLDDSDVPFILEICQKLDGIPLAIEIAAARVEVFGIEGLANRLDDRLDDLNFGRRTAVQRHHTMRNMLDWSFDYLTDADQVVFRRLAVFAGGFSLEAATMIAGDEHIGSAAVTDSVSSLVRKSLLHPNLTARTVTYRLLESTRLYAFEQLDRLGEVDRMRRLHLQYAIDVLERAEREWITTRRKIWIGCFSSILDDVRQALSWAFSLNGDAAAGVRLTALVMPLGMQMGLIDEFRERNDTAIAVARGLPVPELVAEMRLNVFNAFLNTNHSQPVDGTMSGVARAEHLAEIIGEDRYRMQPLFQMAGFRMGMADYPKALSHAETLVELSEKVADGHAALGAQRMLAQTSHLNGLFRRSRELAEAVLASPVVNIPIEFGGVQVDKRVSMRIILSRSLWIQGSADRAVAVLNEALQIAPDDGPHALCQALSLAACPIMFWRGDVVGLSSNVERLIDESSRFALKHWNSWGRMYGNVLAATDTDKVQPTEIPTEGLLQVHTLATITGQLEDIDFADGDIARTTGWAAAEVLRRRAVVLMEKNRREAESLLQRSLEIAKSQQALAWELRTAMTLARFRAEEGDLRGANVGLSEVYGRFTEGFDTRDLRAARVLQQELAI